MATAARLLAVRELSLVLGMREDAQSVRVSENPKVDDLFQLALTVRSRGSPADGRRAAERFREAIAEDPGFAPAWAELAWALELAAINAPDREQLLEQARDAVDRALELAPDMWEAYRELAFLQLVDREWAAAVRSIANARVRAPPAEWPCLDALLRPIAGSMAATAIACARMRRESDPRSLTASAGLIFALYDGGRDKEAYDEYDISRDLVGGRDILEMWGLLLAWRGGDPDRIDTHVRRIGDLNHPTSEPLASLVEVHMDKEAAVETLRASMNLSGTQHPSSQLMHALWLAFYKDDKNAAEALRRAMTAREGGELWAIWMRNFAGVRRRPEFKEIVRELGLAAYWRESGDWPPQCRALDRHDFECF